MIASVATLMLAELLAIASAPAIIGDTGRRTTYIGVCSFALAAVIAAFTIWAGAPR